MLVLELFEKQRAQIVLLKFIARLRRRKTLPPLGQSNL